MVNLGIGLSMGNIAAVVSTLLWGLVIVAVVVVISMVIKNKMKYVYSAEIYKRRSSWDGVPQAQYVSGKAGYFKKKTGKTVFRIKTGPMPWQQIEITRLPNPAYMIGNKAIFLQQNKDNIVQAKVKVDWTGKFVMEPVEDSLKYTAQLDMEERSNILNQKKMSAQTVGFIVMGLILMAGIVVFYFLNKGGP